MNELYIAVMTSLDDFDIYVLPKEEFDLLDTSNIDPWEFITESRNFDSYKVFHSVKSLCDYARENDMVVADEISGNIY